MEVFFFKPLSSTNRYTFFYLARLEDVLSVFLFSVKHVKDKLEKWAKFFNIQLNFKIPPKKVRDEKQKLKVISELQMMSIYT